MRVPTLLVRHEPALPYSGAELRPHAARELFGVRGDALVLWRGPAQVTTARMVDLDDRDTASGIAAADMIHLLWEAFGTDLQTMVLRQRLIAATAAELLIESLAEDHPERAASVRRSGDDVYVGGAKASVSIATLSPLSGLIHFAINVDGGGAPIPTADLRRLGLDPVGYAEALGRRLHEEAASVVDALGKVLPAHGGGEAS